METDLFPLCQRPPNVKRKRSPDSVKTLKALARGAPFDQIDPRCAAMAKETGSYPMAAKQDEEITRAKILETIDRLFYRQGIRAVGVDTIVAELGISKKAPYCYFRSKREMIEAYLRGRFRPLPVDSDKPPAEQILSNFAWLERSL